MLWGSRALALGEQGGRGLLGAGKGFGACLRSDTYLQLALLRASTPEGFPKAAGLRLGYLRLGSCLKGEQHETNEEES